MQPLLPPVTPRDRSDASPGGSRCSDGPDSSISPRKQRRSVNAAGLGGEIAVPVLEESTSRAKLRSPSPNRQSKLKALLHTLELELKRLGLGGSSPPTAQSFRLHCVALGQLAELLPSYKSFLDAVRSQSEGYVAGLQALAAECSKAKSRAKSLKAKLDNVEAQTSLFPCEQKWHTLSNLHRQLDAALSEKEHSNARFQRSQRCQARLEAELQAIRQENQSLQAALEEARLDREQTQKSWNIDKAKLKQLRARCQQLQDEKLQLQEQVARTHQKSGGGMSDSTRLTFADTDCFDKTIKIDSSVLSNRHFPLLKQHSGQRLFLEEALQQAEGVLEPDGEDDRRRQPHFWGVTVGQVTELYDDISADLEAYCDAHKMYFDDQGECVHVCTDSSDEPCKFEHKDVRNISIMQLSDCERSDLKPLRANMHLVVSRHVKPQTKDRDCSWSELNNPKGLQIQVFITHTWSQEFKAFVNTLSHACDPQEAVWICSLAIPQNSDVKSFLNDDNIEQSPFAMALRCAEKFLVILDEDLDVPDRAWCTFEIERAGRWGKPTMLWPHDVGDLPRLQEKMEKIDMAQAKASDAEDLRRIRKCIRESGGFGELNRRLRDLVNDRVRLYLESTKFAESLLQQRDLQLKVDREVRMSLEEKVEENRGQVKELEERLLRATCPDEKHTVNRQLSELLSQVHQDSLQMEVQTLIKERQMLETKLAAQETKLQAQKDRVVELLEQKISVEFRQKKTPKLFLQKTCRALQDLSSKMISCDCPLHMKHAFDNQFENEVDLSLKDLSTYIHDSLGSKLHALPIVRFIFSRVLPNNPSEFEDEDSHTRQDDDGLVQARSEIHKLIESQDSKGLTNKLSLLRTKSHLTTSSIEDDVDVSDLVEHVLQDRKVMEMADNALGEFHRRLIQSKWSRAALSAKLERIENEKSLAERYYLELKKATDDQYALMEESLRQRDEERGRLRKQLSSAKVSTPGNSPSRGMKIEAMLELQTKLEAETERADELAREKTELESEHRKLQVETKDWKAKYRAIFFRYGVTQSELETLRQTRPGLENFVPKTAIQLLFGALHSTYQEEIHYGMPQWPQKIKEHVLKQLKENVTIDLLEHLHAFYIEALRKGPSREIVRSLPFFLPEELTNPNVTHTPTQVLHRKSAPPKFHQPCSPVDSDVDVEDDQ